ncbi:MAG: hypothetical protein LBD80_06145 [Tannerella sp.]|jgi:hypothetical protein|nr:hypothetical protein [Tannerella sp.]
MKEVLYFITLSLLLLLLSCKDMGNSPIKGKWQLKTVEREGVVSYVDTLWYNFQSISLFTLQIYLVQKDMYVQLTGYRTEHDNILAIEIESSSYLENTDWMDFKRTFIIEKCRGGELVLVSEENYVYRFVRF